MSSFIDPLSMEGKKIQEQTHKYIYSFAYKAEWVLRNPHFADYIHRNILFSF